MKIKPGEKSGEVVIKLEAGEARLPTAKAEVAPLPVFRLKKILVPLDFSNCSRKALQYALPFARQFEAELVLLHVIQPIVPASGMEPFPTMVPAQSELTEDVQKQLKALQLMVEDAVPSRTLARMGNPYIEIIEAAKELNVDLIILSTHGHTGLEHVFLGSTTEKVVRHASCPVLVIREHERDFIVTDSLAAHRMNTENRFP